MTRVRVRPTKAKQQTMCRTCGHIVGVTTTPWNSTTPHDVPPKTVPHRWEGAGKPASRCPGSLLSVHPNTVMEAV